MNESRTYGVEIEIRPLASEHIYSPRQQCQDIALALSRAGVPAINASYSAPDQYEGGCWKVCWDPSAGPEIVSPPLRGLEGFAQIEEVCGVLKRLGAKVDSRCGLHVHHDARDITIEQVIRITALYSVHQEIINLMLPVSRWVSRYAKTLPSETYAEKPLKDRLWSWGATTKRDVCARTSNGDRYVAVNWQAFRRHGTVEFRQHSGTISAEKIRMWVLLTQALITSAIERKAEVRLLPPAKAPGIDPVAHRRVGFFMALSKGLRGSEGKEVRKFYTRRIEELEEARV